MERMYPILTSPITLGTTTFRNRMFAAPTSATDMTPDLTVGPKSVAYYELKAKGGAAAVTMSPVKIHPETNEAQAFSLNLTTIGSLASFKYTSDAISRHGAVPSMLLSHGGQFAGAYMTDKAKLDAMTQYGPIDCIRYDGVPVKGLTVVQMESIAKSYAETAKLAKRAGFGMLTVHGGHGWLLNQFFSEYFNKRTDEFGGSVENRCRFPMMVLSAIREAVGPGFPIEIRISGREGIEGGYNVDEACRIAEVIESKVDLIHVSAGSHRFGFHITHPSMFDPHGVNVPLAAAVKQHVRVPVATLGAINDPAMMEEILADGKADVIEMGRELLADPFLPNKVMANRPEDIHHCMRCFVCMSERVSTTTRRCAINPLIGHETEGMEIVPAAKKRRVLVAGGGIAGMEAAVTAARRGHSVVLCEKSGRLGGILLCEERVPFKQEMYLISQNLERECRAEGVEIRLNTTVTPEYAESEAFDAVIIAVGSEPRVCTLPGAEYARQVTDYYLHGGELGSTVAVVGAGLTGCEAAIHLAREGKTVHLVSRSAELAKDANVRHRPALLREIEKQGVCVHTACAAQEITEGSVRFTDAGGKECSVSCDSVLLALGQVARRESADALLGAAPFVRQIGDCVRASDITHAVYEGYHAALDI